MKSQIMYLRFYFPNFESFSLTEIFSSIRLSSFHTNHIILFHNINELGKSLCLVSTSKLILKAEFATISLPALFKLSNAEKGEKAQDHSIKQHHCFSECIILSQVSSSTREECMGSFPSALDF